MMGWGIRRGVGWLAGLVWAGAIASSAHAQQAQVAVRTARVSPETVELGDVFTLRVSVFVPAGRDLRVPPSLPAEWGVESLGRVRTESVVAEDGSAQVALEYELIPFEIGLAATPYLEMASGEAAPGEERVRVEDGSEGLGEGAEDRLVVAGRRVFVTSPVLLEDIARGLQPRAPADVVGSSWNLPAVLGASVLSLLLLGVVTLQAREWLLARAAASIREEEAPDTPEVWRAHALNELDRLFTSGHHRKGRPRDFYEGASEVVREYVEHFAPGWNRSWTSTELMRALSAEAGWPEPDELGRAMDRAEMAKFAAAAGVREGPQSAAERDWRAMRAWVDVSAQAPAFARMAAAISGETEDGATDTAEPDPTLQAVADDVAEVESSAADTAEPEPARAADPADGTASPGAPE